MPELVIVRSAALVVLIGCAAAGGMPAARPSEGALHGTDLAADADPTVRGARLIPADLTQARAWGKEAGGGTRAMVAGVRVVDWPDGSIDAAEDRLPSAVSAVTTVPQRMGGGFLFTAGAHLWRADGWLSPARPVFTAAAAISNVHVGLDRVYVREQSGALGAIDPRSGALLDLGSIPGSPALGRIAALDAWRAVAVTDLRGAELTLDAGSTWRPLALPIEPSEVIALGDSLAIGGMDEAHQVEWWEVRAQGQLGRIAAAPAPAGDDGGPASTLDSVARAFGARPLIAAVEDGWPLRDGTALVARNGALARVRLGDGSVAEAVADAFPLRPARCHPVSLSRPAEPGAFGFVCGEPRGATTLYRWDPARGRLVELRRFAVPREVVTSDNGGLAVRGPCDPAATVGGSRSVVAWCLSAPGQPWREIHFRGDEVDQARPVVLSDGRVALIRPPAGADLSTARLTLTDGTTSTHLPLIMPELRADVARALRLGVWMDGFAERRPGVLSGWVDAAGAVLGVEVDLEGHVRVGEYLRDAGAPFVSGRWGFGWTASRRGFETTDGGMTWQKEIEMPDPIATPRDVGERACGPVGCLVAGWMRVGWGAPAATERLKAPAPPLRPPSRDMPPLDLRCTPTAGPAPVAPASPRRVPKVTLPLPGIQPLRGWMSSAPPIVPCAAQLAFFQGRAAPALTADECAVQLDASASLDHPIVPMGLSHVYAWGSRSGDWDATGRWKIAWLWPWGGWHDARASLTTAAPFPSRDAAARFLGISPPSVSLWTLMPSDDPDHALLLARRAAAGRVVDIVALESDRAPTPVRHPNGDPFADLQGATRVAGRWYVATAQSPGELPATVIWAIDGGSAHELARLPRVGGDSPAVSHLAHRTDGAAVGLVVEGQPGLDRAQPGRWVVSIDLESGGVSEPERLAPVDLSDDGRAICTGDDAGWLVDLPYSGPVTVHVGPDWAASLQGAAARLRLSPTSACLERVSGSVARDAHPVAHTVEVLTGTSTARLDARTFDASVYTSAIRYGLRCRPSR